MICTEVRLSNEVPGVNRIVLAYHAAAGRRKGAPIKQEHKDRDERPRTIHPGLCYV